MHLHRWEADLTLDVPESGDKRDSNRTQDAWRPETGGGAGAGGVWTSRALTLSC